jgi:hypothetical protein
MLPSPLRCASTPHEHGSRRRAARVGVEAQETQAFASASRFGFPGLAAQRSPVGENRIVAAADARRFRLHRRLREGARAEQERVETWAHGHNRWADDDARRDIQAPPAAERDGRAARAAGPRLCVRNACDRLYCGGATGM